MSMATESDRRDFRRQVFFSLGGITVGLVVAGLIALLINNVIEPQMRVETQDLVKFPGEVFSIWYHVDSPHMKSRHDLLPRLEEAMDDLLDRLDVSIDDIPLPIDVLVHGDPSMMQQSILRRKSALALYSFYAVIDLVYGEDPYSRLGELVLAFGWGRCSSQLLYRGMLLGVSFPERNFHTPLAAAPSRLLHSLQDLIRLEAANAFEETLYQRYQSPFSQRLAIGTFEGLGEFKAMLSAFEDESSEYDISELQAASLVQYLIECSGGLHEFRKIWGPGTTEALIARLACGPLTDLAGDWLVAARESGVTEDGFEYYQARFLYEAGEIETAANITQTWSSRSLSGSESILAVRTQLAVGNFETAGRFANAADSSVTRTLVDWVDAYAGWQQVTDGSFTILGDGTEEDLSEVLQQVQAAYEWVTEAFEFHESELPSHITVFYYETDEDREQGPLVIPVVSTHRTMWHISSQDSIVEAFVVALPAFVMKKETASNLLRRGLTAVLTIDREELVERGCESLHAGEWIPLWRLGFGGVPNRMLEVQTGLMIQFVIDTYGVEVIRDLWLATARVGGGLSLDTAFANFLNTSRTQIETELIESVLNCE